MKAHSLQARWGGLILWPGTRFSRNSHFFPLKFATAQPYHKHKGIGQGSPKATLQKQNRNHSWCWSAIYGSLLDCVVKVGMQDSSSPHIRPFISPTCFSSSLAVPLSLVSEHVHSPHYNLFLATRPKRLGNTCGHLLISGFPVATLLGQICLSLRLPRWQARLLQLQPSSRDSLLVLKNPTHSCNFSMHL